MGAIFSQLGHSHTKPLPRKVIFRWLSHKAKSPPGTWPGGLPLGSSSVGQFNALVGTTGKITLDG